MFQNNVHPKCFQWGCRPLAFFQPRPSWTSLCAKRHCHAGTDLVPMKKNLNAFVTEDILYNACILCMPPLCGEGPRMGVMVKLPHTFGHNVSLKIIEVTLNLC